MSIDTSFNAESKDCNFVYIKCLVLKLYKKNIKITKKKSIINKFCDRH